MEIDKACRILGIDKKQLYTLTNDEIKHKYRKLALKYHPDKCTLPIATETFQSINEAYEYICIQREIIPEKTDYKSLLLDYLGYYFSDPELVIELLVNGINTSVLHLFTKLDKKYMSTLYIFLVEHKTLFHIPETILESIQKKINEPNTIEIVCSIQDMIQKKVYILEYDKQTLYVPLWHEEIVYSIHSRDLLVKCTTTLPDNIYIDKDNNLHITVTKVLTEQMLHNDNWLCHVDGLGDIHIPYKVKLKQYQTITLEHKGIPVINEINIFDDTTLSNMVIHLYLELS